MPAAYTDHQVTAWSPSIGLARPQIMSSSREQSEPRWVGQLPKDGSHHSASDATVTNGWLELPSCGRTVILSHEAVTGRTSQLRFFSNFIASLEERQLILEQLLRELPWTQRSGKWGPEPRLTAWYGRSYTYSGVSWQPKAVWHPLLVKLRLRAEQLLFGPEQNSPEEPFFNSVLCNLYRTGRDSIGAHSDDEPELGKYPVIASLSLGAERNFVMQAKDCGRVAELRLPVGNRVSLRLSSGSLLVMQAATQCHWRHSVPKSADQTPRINLTFRRIYDAHRAAPDSTAS